MEQIFFGLEKCVVLMFFHEREKNSDAFAIQGRVL